MSFLSGSRRFEYRVNLQGSRGHHWPDHEPAEAHLISHPHSNSYSVTGLGRLVGFQEVEAPIISIRSAH
jgi:hypothetical protein